MYTDRTNLLHDTGAVVATKTSPYSTSMALYFLMPLYRDHVILVIFVITITLLYSSAGHTCERQHAHTCSKRVPGLGCTPADLCSGSLDSVKCQSLCTYPDKRQKLDKEQTSMKEGRGHGFREKLHKAIHK
jgi:hypothetical protein